MVESKLVSIDDLLKNNPRLCLSVLRVFNKCEECEKYNTCESKVILKKIKLELKE